MRALWLLLCGALLAGCGDLYAARGGDVFEAHVVRVVETSEREVPGSAPQLVQRLQLELDGSLYRGDRVEVGWGGRPPINENGLLRPADRVLVSARRADDGSRQYAIEEVVRLPALAPFAAVLVAALVTVARLKGLSALAGLAAGIAVFLLAVVPAVQRGDDPLVATLVGTVGVLAATVYVVHGLDRRSTAALVGACFGLLVVGGLAAAALSLARITGLGSEEAASLAIGTGFRVDMPKLILAGVIIGSLGALVDLSVGQAWTTFELASVDPSLRGGALYAAAVSLGSGHLGSLVNTLALAYFGSALPLVVLLSLGNAPLAVALNSEMILSSLLAVLVASVGLVLCVPLTTAAAVALAER